MSVAECCVIKDYIKRLSSVAMAASAAAASLPEPRALEELSLTPPSSLPGRGGLRTEAASNCIEKLIAYAQASNPSFRGLRGDESRRGVKHAHAQPRRPRLSPGDSPGDARAHAQSAPLRGARSPPFPSVHTFFSTHVFHSKIVLSISVHISANEPCGSAVTRARQALLYCATPLHSLPRQQPIYLQS